MANNGSRQRVLSFSQEFRKNTAWGVALGITLFGVFLVAPARAAVFTVNSPADPPQGDAKPGDGVCETAVGNKVCTLRAAIQETNALAGADEIILPPNTYLLTQDTELTITSNLTITGDGKSTTIIDGNKSVRSSGVLKIFSLGARVNLSGVTIQNGLRTGDGGGISNAFFAIVTLINSTVSGNSAFRGGGIYNLGILTLINSTVSRNSAGFGDGAGIYNDDGSTMTLINSTVSGNGTNGGSGAGIWNNGTANLFSATITENRTDFFFYGSGIGAAYLMSRAVRFSFRTQLSPEIMKPVLMIWCCSGGFLHSEIARELSHPTATT